MLKYLIEVKKINEPLFCFENVRFPHSLYENVYVENIGQKSCCIGLLNSKHCYINFN